MSENLLIQLCRDRARSVGQWLQGLPANGTWGTQAAGAGAVHDLQEAVLACLDYPELVKRAWDSSWDRIDVEDLDDYTRKGEAVRGAFAEASGVVERTRQLAALASSAGASLRGAAILAEVAARLENLRQEFENTWPWFSAERLKEARAEAQQGETIELDDAFAGMAGLSRDKWLQRVEEHKRLKSS